MSNVEDYLMCDVMPTRGFIEIYGHGNFLRSERVALPTSHLGMDG